MLTADLVAARKYKGELKLVALDAGQRLRALALAEAYIALARDHVGRTREELSQAWASVEVLPRDRRLGDGLRKLVEDRLEFDADESLDPAALRRALFTRATAVRRGGAGFDRAAIVAEVAQAEGLAPDALERGLYADLRGAHLLRAVEPVSARALAEGYDLSQAQAVLLRAARVVADVWCDGPGGYRALFRKLKFLRLLFTIERRDEAPGEGEAGRGRARAREGGYTIAIDGPLSLFEQTTRYGLQLALALPAIAACDAWRLVADVKWGKERVALSLRLEGGRGRTRAGAKGDESEGAPVGGERDATPAEGAMADDVAALYAALRDSSGDFRVAPSTEILDLPGVGVCVPDLVFVHVRTRRRVHLEVLGYWSRDAVWKRVEMIERGLLTAGRKRGASVDRVLFAVSQHLRVSEAALPDESAGALYVYKRTMSASAVLAKVAALAAR